MNLVSYLRYVNLRRVALLCVPLGLPALNHHPTTEIPPVVILAYRLHPIFGNLKPKCLYHYHNFSILLSNINFTVTVDPSGYWLPFFFGAGSPL